MTPRAGGLAQSSAVLAAFPALLSSAACCGPIVFVVLGVQATGVLLTGVQLRVPLSVVLLLTSLLVLGQRIDPAMNESNACETRPHPSGPGQRARPPDWIATPLVTSAWNASWTVRSMS